MSPTTETSAVPAFDHQLKTLSDSYIAFFVERVRIEEIYVESLTRLHRNTRALDNLLDDRDPSTVRRAWIELRDNVEREAEARTALINTLKTDVLPPLQGMRETQERTRKRIKEDLKESTAAHVDYLENTLPRLKRAYLKKCQEVEDFKAADKPMSPAPPGSMGPPLGPAAASNSGGGDEFSPPRRSLGDRERSGIISPTPTHPSSMPLPGSRNRSPSTGTALSDLAHQGKKGFNQLMGLLEQGRERGGISGSIREDPANGLRTVRAKREADIANKEYRKGVHWLETLRLRRIKILQAGYTSLESFVTESGTVMDRVLHKYVDGVTGTASTCSHLASYAQEALGQVNNNQDLERVHNFVQYAFTRAIPPQAYYYNYYVGECRDLVFGVSLVDYATTHKTNDVPSIVQKCINEVDKRGLDSEGIYRVSGRHAIVNDLTLKIERNERIFEFNAVTEDVYAISGLLKLYLRELPEPVFRFPLVDRIQYSENRDEHIASNFTMLKSKIRRLPPVHQVTLRAIVEHLARVVSHFANNKMDSRNLAIVFNTVIFGEDEMPKGSDVLSLQTFKDTVMEDLINHAHTLFDDIHPPLASSSASGHSARGPRPNSVIFPTAQPSIHTLPSVTSVISNASVTSLPSTEAPLPIVPIEPPVQADYGSSFTQVRSLPPRTGPSSSGASSSTVTANVNPSVPLTPTIQPPTPGQPNGFDFSPALPSQPQLSIHPSRRSINAPPSSTGEERRPSASRAASILPQENDIDEGMEPVDYYDSDSDQPLSEYVAVKAASIRSGGGSSTTSPTKSSHTGGGNDN